MIYLAPALILNPATVASFVNPTFLWDNLLLATALAADHEDADYPASNLANPQTSSLWKSGSTAAQDLTVTLDGTIATDAIGIARHNFGSGAIGVTIEGLLGDDGAEWTTLAELSPGDDRPILALFEADYYVGLRLHLVPAAVAPQAGVLYVGAALVMPRSTPAGFVPLTDALGQTLLSGVAENGDFLGDIVVSEQLATSVTIKLLEPAWYRQYVRPFVQAAVPFFYAWSPALQPGESGYAKFSKTPQGSVNQLTGEVDIVMQITGLAL